MAYVYIYYDPRKTPIEPIYIGKGIDDRMYHHINKKCHNPILERKLTKIKELGLEPIIEKVQDNLSDEDALNMEIELITKYGRIDLKTGTLCNLTEGGEGSSGRIVSDETKQLWSEQRKGKKQTDAQYAANCNRTMSEERKKELSEQNKGKDFLTPEQREKIRIKSLGKTPSDETKKLWSEQRKGKKQTPAQYAANCNREYKNYKKVKCLNTNIVYESINVAAESLNLKTTAIAAVARGDRNSHQGYQFIYLD